MSSIGILFRVFAQSLRLSLEEVRASRLRSFLSLLGVSIGVLCIVSVRTSVGSLEKNIQDSIASFGSDVLYIQKWPWLLGGDYPWWRYYNRPQANAREMNLLRERLNSADACAIIYMSGGKKLQYRSSSTEGVMLSGVSIDYNKVKVLEFVQGRYFTASEVNSGSPVALIGSNIAETLFGAGVDVEGKEIRIDGIKVRVIGQLKKEGDDIFGFTMDNNVIVPYSVMSNFMDMSRRGGDSDPLIAVTPKKGVDVEELKYEVRGVLRGVRRLAPNVEDNFAINQVSVFAEGISAIFGIVNIAGMCIGIFSVLVGGFGIANIMFVSVKERTYIIGIKKAIGAKKIYILLEFLLEAVVLCVIGGITGLLVVVVLFGGLQYYLANVVETDFKFYITTANLLYGITISVITGILAGFIPAYSAANMRPVDAIRS
jgi:putative ABC transport system permease protein